MSSSLTPARLQEASDHVMHEGIVSGVLTFIPTMGVLYAAMQNKRFLASTNWQSRTAMAIMPALFAFGWTGENALISKMRKIAKEEESEQQQRMMNNETNNNNIKWAESSELQKKLLAENNAQLQQKLKSIASQDDDDYARLTAMYRKSVEEDSGVCIIPRLGLHHKMANYADANPMKVLTALAVPSVVWIFYGNNGQQHLSFSVKLLKTRVFGQFATLSLMLGIMGFKEFMDKNGKFITEDEANARVAEMHQVHRDLLERLAIEKQHDLQLQQEIAKAHEEDVHDHNVHTRAKKHHHHKMHKNNKTQHEEEVVAV